jgi:hypothetical protein
MFQIKDSISVQVAKAPAIAIAGPSGSGKTESAMRLARGYVGAGKKFVVIDTEEKRALYKKSRYQPWDWIDFQPPFTPECYVEVLKIAQDYPAVVLDSGSHEYSGPGGLQDIQMATLERMAKGNDARMEALTAPSWKEAKHRHKTIFMQYLIRYPTLLIVCLRAEPKVKFVKVMKDGRERTEIVDAGYVPICEKMFMYEMLVGCMMTADAAGVPQHVKRLEPDLEPVFLAGKQIDEGTGERLAAWARGTALVSNTIENAALTKEAVDKLVDSLDVENLDELEQAYFSAREVCKQAHDKAARDRIRTVYEQFKARMLKERPVETDQDFFRE